MDVENNIDRPYKQQSRFEKIHTMKIIVTLKINTHIRSHICNDTCVIRDKRKTIVYQHVSSSDEHYQGKYLDFKFENSHRYSSGELKIKVNYLVW